MIVVDSSVIAGLVIPKDAYHTKARKAFERDPAWHATMLYHSELRSVAAGHLRKGEPVQNLLIFISHAALAVQEHSLTDQEVLAVLVESPLSAYDAEPVALARRLGCALVTTDKEILRYYPGVAVSLEDFALSSKLIGATASQILSLLSRSVSQDVFAGRHGVHV